MSDAPLIFTGLKVTYYDDAKQELLAKCLVPLALKAQGHTGVRAAWVQSHWRLGPHSTLYVHGEESVLNELIPEFRATVDDYLLQHPSHRKIDPLAYEKISKELGRLELTEPPYLPLTPDNTVSQAGEQPVDTFLRSRAAIALKGRIIGRGLHNVMSGDGSIAAEGEAFSSAFRGMAALAVSYPKWGLISGYQAFLSHWKEYFYWADSDGALELALSQSFEQQRDALVEIVSTAADLDAQSLSGDPVLNRWITWVREAMPAAEDLAAAGDILPYPHPDRLVQAKKFGEATAVQWSGSDERGYSDFHAAFRALDFTIMGNGTDFAAYRFLINNFFELLPVMGITPIQRYSLAYFFSTAAQVVAGETWDVTIAKTVSRQKQESPDSRPTLPWVGQDA